MSLGESWTAYDAFAKGIDLSSQVVTQPDGTLSVRRRPGDSGVCIASAEVFGEGTFSVEMLVRNPDPAGNPYISIASTLPHPLETAWEKQIPFGIEVKLKQGIAGKIVLPSPTFKVTLPSGQKREERQVPAIREAALKANEWNKWEIECDRANNVTVKLNGVTVNTLGKAENVSGHIVIWLPDSDIEIRNASMVSKGRTIPLTFDRTVTAASP